MNAMNPATTAGEEVDLLIDDVRAIRRSICDLYGKDVEKLAEHLRGVEQEYRGRTGRFAGVPLQPGQELFPDALKAEADPFLSDLRKLRNAYELKSPRKPGRAYVAPERRALEARLCAGKDAGGRAANGWTCDGGV